MDPQGLRTRHSRPYGRRGRVWLQALTRRDDKAKYHFGMTAGDSLPSSVEATVVEFLRRIDALKRWSVSVSAAILPKSNPARRTESEEVRVGNVPFRLGEDARSSSGVGKLVGAGTSFSPVIADDLRAALAASAAAKFYDRSEWNDLSVSGEIGLTRLSDRGSMAGGFRLGQRWLGGDPRPPELRTMGQDGLAFFRLDACRPRRQRARSEARHAALSRWLEDRAPAQRTPYSGRPYSDRGRT